MKKIKTITGTILRKPDKRPLHNKTSQALMSLPERRAKLWRVNRVVNKKTRSTWKMSTMVNYRNKFIKIPSIDMLARRGNRMEMDS